MGGDKKSPKRVLAQDVKKQAQQDLKRTSYWLADSQPQQQTARVEQPKDLRPPSPHSQEPLRRKDLWPVRLNWEKDKLVCSVSGKPLQFSKNSSDDDGGDANNNNNNGSGSIVVCPYGRLYNKEAAVEALLRRKQGKGDGAKRDELGEHVRGLKDLHAVRFHLVETEQGDGGKHRRLVPTCPVRGTELNGHITAVVLVPGRSGAVNVVSERALQEMPAVVEDDHGPVEQKIRLAPPATVLDEIKRALAKRRAEEKSAKKKKDKKKDKKNKRKHHDDSKNGESPSTSSKKSKKENTRTSETNE